MKAAADIDVATAVGARGVDLGLVKYADAIAEDFDLSAAAGTGVGGAGFTGFGEQGGGSGVEFDIAGGAG